VRLAQKRGKDMAKLREAILLLIEGSPLPPRYKEHPLGGEWKHFRDCHIEPDWLLIYKIDGDDLHLVRTGTHSDLFSRTTTSSGTLRTARAHWSSRQ
jgi:mRNA interferase YafQ